MIQMTNTSTPLMSQVHELVSAAGQAVLKFYGSSARVTHKADNSPLTEADQASHQLLEAGLRPLLANCPVVSEESASSVAEPPKNGRYWLVDPLDGTKEFLKGTGEFTVNVALIEGSKAILGCVHAPVLNLTYFAERDQGAFRQSSEHEPAAIRTRVLPTDPSRLVVVASKDHAGPKVAAMMAKLPGASLANMGSSLKFCLVAEGKADLYLRDLPTMEWDTAAAQCVVETAGGGVYELSGQALGYGKTALRNPAIMTVGDPNSAWMDYLT
jgi:3'(2'), 5'-bisphosphate nucleotidase